MRPRYLKYIRQFFFLDQQSDFQNFPNLPLLRERVLNILQKHGSPIFLADTSIILDRYNELKRCLTLLWPKTRIAYSFKTNYSVARSQILQREGAWAEVISGKEYATAKKFGYPGKKIVFNGPLKRDKELLNALDDGALIHVDNKEELVRLIRLTKSSKAMYGVGIRVSARISGLQTSRFGFSLDDGEALDILRMFRKTDRLHLTSLHFHIGTDVDRVTFYRQATRHLSRFARSAERLLQNPLTFLDLGGGFPASGLKPYGKRCWRPATMQTYIESMTGELSDTFSKNRKPILLLEPGRYFVDDAVVFITQIVSKRMSGGRQTLVVDAAVTMLPLKHYRPQIIKTYSAAFAESVSRKVPTLVFGATCREDDILYDGWLPEASAGHYLVFYCVGAYNESLGSAFVFDQPKTIFLSPSTAALTLQ